MVNISEFELGKSTIQPLMLQKTHREYGKELHVVFVDLEKAYARVPRELAQTKNVFQRPTFIIRDMYAGCKTSAMTSAGETKDNFIDIEVLYQGSAMGPLLFVIIIHVITEEIEE